ncbi:MAG: cytochrome C [Pirellulales bacterium]|nr:cytochrome C [Pirellulales bacterium]
MIVLFFFTPPALLPISTNADPITEHFPEAASSGCLKCHSGIELIREPGSEMLRQIMERGKALGDPAGCVVCHGGDAKVTTDKAAAHGGTFYPAPASPWVNEHTCGKCHEEQVRVQWNSLMMTEAGKIQGTCWAFGPLEGYEHRWANYAAKNPEDPSLRRGTTAYRDYMALLKKSEPNVFVDKHDPLPEALKADELHRLHDDPSQAAFTYIRQECQRCHHAVKGRQARGDYRGIGCASCHTPYSNEGFYEGGDPTISRDEPGHMLVHSIQGTREAKVKVHGTSYTGIPVETCTTCHDRGKRIGVSYQGLMESPYPSPFTADGGDQPPLHTKHYVAMHQDIHYQKGMLCQDCHTSLDVHGDGFLAAANLAAVEIECSDCHGTPDKYPWELPLGFMDEFSMNVAQGAGRGVAFEALPSAAYGSTPPIRDGFLLTARGNPFENVVRDGEEVIVHTAAGKDLRLQPLKKLFEEKRVSLQGSVAMRGVSRHINRLECYTCHTSWAPQCYGCHVKIDFTQKGVAPEGKLSLQAFDWVAAGRKHEETAHRNDRGEKGYDTVIPGTVREERSYTRWEDPILGINGEGRVSPLVPGCQTSVTVIGADGKPVIANKIYRTQANSEGAGAEGQLSIDMSPTQPHTMTKNARSCESCHASAKAVGLGVGSTRPWNERHFVDLETVTGKILPNRTRPQMEPIEGLDHDWSQIVDEDGKQLATVGHHFKLSRAFNATEINHIRRDGTCAACHREIPDKSLAVSFLHHVAEATGQLPKSAEDHGNLIHKILLTTAWAQLIALAVVVGAIVLAWRRFSPFRKSRSR